MKALLLPALLLLAACAASPSAASNGLAGSEWRFVTIDGAAAASSKARLHFSEDEIGANVGCNGMGGKWHMEGGRLIAGPLVQTEIYCEGSVWGQEQAVGALLVAAPEMTLSAERLVLKSSGHSAELERLLGAEPRPR